MLLPAHWSAQYAGDRLRASYYEWTHPDTPWYTRDAIAYLARWINGEHMGLEWGSGRSTLWYGRRAAGLLTIEHDGVWYDRTLRKLQASGLDNVTLVRKDDAPQSYVEPGRALEDNLLDFAVVDGIHRDWCAEVAIKKLRSGGILVIDDIHRYFPSDSRAPLSLGLDKPMPSDRWKRVHLILSGWDCRWTSDGVRDTAIWTKP